MRWRGTFSGDGLTDCASVYGASSIETRTSVHSARRSGYDEVAFTSLSLGQVPARQKYSGYITVLIGCSTSRIGQIVARYMARFVGLAHCGATR